MAKLTGLRIQNEVEAGRIVIDPFNPKHLGPNSYDLTLGPELRLYKNTPDYHSGINPLDAKRENPTKVHTIGHDGYVLYPGKLYLAHTNEIAGSEHYVPCIEGRSSMARLGIQVHLTAGFGDVGFINQWTLEILVVHPVKIYRDIRICQVYFDTLEGTIDRLYDGKYNETKGAVASRSWLDDKPFKIVEPPENVEKTCRDCHRAFITASDSPGRCIHCGGTSKPELV